MNQEYERTSQTSEQGLNGRFTFLNRASLTRWAPIPLRLIVGYGFMQHGFAKLCGSPEAFAAILHAIGVPAPHLMAWLTILIEVFGGLAILLGALHSPCQSADGSRSPRRDVYRTSALWIQFDQAVSVNSGRAQFGPPGYESNLLYLACLAALVLGGSGPLAIDGYLTRKS